LRSRPVDISDARLIAAVADGWGLQVADLAYVAVGGGSHHWKADHWWITVDDLDAKPFLGATRAQVFDGLRTALQVADSLRRDGFDFVIAPRPTELGEMLVPLGEQYALAVYPFLAGRTFAWGSPLPDVQRWELLQALIRLHGVTGTGARVAAVELGERATLERALDEAHDRWTGGPYSEGAEQVVLQHESDLRYLLATFDGLARQVQPDRMVLTHGEPHPANVMVSPAGKLLLLDWDTVGLAPPERDLWWLADDVVGQDIDQAAMQLYRLRWQLDDVAYALSRLRAPHTDDIEARLCSTTLARSVEVPAWMR
jgi:spectinomycin phosphotransferase